MIERERNSRTFSTFKVMSIHQTSQGSVRRSLFEYEKGNFENTNTSLSVLSNRFNFYKGFSIHFMYNLRRKDVQNPIHFQNQVVGGFLEQTGSLN